MEHAQARICSWNMAHKILCDFDMLMDYPVQARRPDPVSINKRKITFQQMDFIFLADHKKKKNEVLEK